MISPPMVCNAPGRKADRRTGRADRDVREEANASTLPASTHCARSTWRPRGSKVVAYSDRLRRVVSPVQSLNRACAL